MSWPRGDQAKSGCLIVGALLASWDVDDDKHNGERQGFSYWSGYTPGKSNPDETVTPLNRDELRVEAARFRRGALRARERGDAAEAARLHVAANDFEHRADQATGE
jgi:hypothetical protein